MTYQGDYDAVEQAELTKVFVAMLDSCTKDGGNKRNRGEKPPWWCDETHEAALFSHLNKWKHGELKDADSGAHPLVHLAWRALAIAYQETHGKVKPHGRQEALPHPRLPLQEGWG